MFDPVTYRITYDDYLSFSQLHQLRSFKPFSIYMVCLVAVIVVGSLYAGQVDTAVGAFGGGILAIVGLPIFGRFVLIPWQTKRTYREYDLIHEDMELALSGKAL
ncbi:MAG: hypothetical protein AAGL10_02315 [Pseudomonadota bacterium]